jgi:hypothetical protein
MWAGLDRTCRQHPAEAARRAARAGGVMMVVRMKGNWVDARQGYARTGHARTGSWDARTGSWDARTGSWDARTGSYKSQIPNPQSLGLIEGFRSAFMMSLVGKVG